jgi:hypothetical protein
MNIHEISERFSVSVGKLRKMNKAGILICDESADPLLDEMRYYLRRGQPLTTKHLLALIEAPAKLEGIGRGREQAAAQIAALGKPIEPAPQAVALELSGAAMNEAASVATVMRWMQAAIPAHREVSHYFLGVRLLLALPDAQRAFEIPRLHRTLLNIRKRQEFAGWFRVVKQGSRSVTLYHRPANSALDL